MITLTFQDIACPPHLCDPYESGLVEVKVSNVAEGSGEGLYAKGFQINHSLTHTFKTELQNILDPKFSKPSVFKDNLFFLKKNPKK